MKRYCECRGTMVHSIGACIGCEDKPEPMEPVEIFDLAEKVADLVRDAFYEACETMQSWNGTLGPMSQDELFSAWMESEARKQLIGAFPTLTDAPMEEGADPFVAFVRRHSERADLTIDTARQLIRGLASRSETQAAALRAVAGAIPDMPDEVWALIEAALGKAGAAPKE